MIIIEERSISPLTYKKADELFLTNVVSGIQPITKYRKRNMLQTFNSIS